MKRFAFFSLLFLAGCSAVYVSENRTRGNSTDNPTCVFACATKVNEAASAPGPQ